MTDSSMTAGLILLGLWLLTSAGVWLRSDRRSILCALWGGLYALVKHSGRLIFWIGVGWIAASLIGRRR